jgi:Ca2+-binding EF-hand superfamily protein
MFLVLVLLCITITALPVHADDELQQKAEQILRSEPGARQVTVKEEVTPKDVIKGRSVDFMSFDIDGDGTLSRDEVGEKLFQFFDRDGNQVIDNIEMEKPSIFVFTPMTKKTIEIVDYATGQEAKTSMTEEEFLQKSQLAKFDQDEDGLSPLDFLGVPFNKVNVKKDGVIDLYEFKRAYAASVRPRHEESFNYN